MISIGNNGDCGTSRAVMACGRWRLATHSQQIVGGFGVGMTPSWARPEDKLLRLSASAKLAVTSLLTARSGFDVSRWRWSDETPTQTPCLYPLFSHPFFSSSLLLLFIPPSACPCLYLLWSVISLPLSLPFLFVREHGQLGPVLPYRFHPRGTINKT